MEKNFSKKMTISEMASKGNKAMREKYSKEQRAIGVSGSVELIFDDTTYKTLALAGTQKAMRIDIQNTDVTIGASSNPGLQIDLAKAKFVEYALKRDLKGIVTQSLNFKAFYSLSDTKMITALLTNLVTSY